MFEHKQHGVHSTIFVMVDLAKIKNCWSEEGLLGEARGGWYGQYLILPFLQLNHNFNFITILSMLFSKLKKYLNVTSDQQINKNKKI